MSDSFSRLTRRRNSVRVVFLLIILATAPCYCLGAILLATAPDDTQSRTQQENIATLGVRTSTPLPSLTPTLTPFRRDATMTPFGNPLGPTPSQFWLPTNTPFYFATWTPYATITPFPTSTTAPTMTTIPTNTLAPTTTLAPTNIPAPTQTSVPTRTMAPLPSNTAAPIATSLPTMEPSKTPVPTDPFAPTQEVMPSSENGGTDGVSGEEGASVGPVDPPPAQE